VLSIYLDDCGERQSNQRTLFGRITRLNDFWGDFRLSEVTGDKCREYAQHVGRRGAARRDLEDLRAAINHHAAEGLHRAIVRVVLPPRGRPRDRWLTRDEAAALIRACRRAREAQTVHRGHRKGQTVFTAKETLAHLARFILIGLYTGTRSGAILTASPYRGEGRSFVDLERGLFYRLAEGAVETKKRQPPVPLPARLLAHMRRGIVFGCSRRTSSNGMARPCSRSRHRLRGR
jgi:integrase